MADKTIETINHNYEPVNKYIDDQARLKRSISSWRYAKSTARRYAKAMTMEIQEILDTELSKEVE